MKLDLTHDMYLPDPHKRVRKPRPTPARDRADRPVPNGSQEEREDWMRSRQAPRGKERTLNAIEFAIARTLAQLEGRDDLTQEEQNTLTVCRAAVERYKRR